MPRPMRKYKSIEKVKEEKHSFKAGRFGHRLYAEDGNIKTYANITQADKKVIQLRLQGLNVVRSISYPYTLRLDET